jgi:hypothetical protein
MEQLCGMGDAVLDDPQGQKQFLVDSVRLNEAFNNALDMNATSLWQEPRWPEEIESGVAPRLVEFPRQNVRRHTECVYCVSPASIRLLLLYSTH